MDSLPNELLTQIALNFDIEAPSITRFSHEPSTRLTECESTPLKNLSRVSWRWREIVRPILFYYLRVPLDKEPRWVPVDARLVADMQANLSKLSNHESQIYHKMRSKFESIAYDQLINLCQIQEGDEFLNAVPHILWIPHLTSTFEAFTTFVAQYNLKHHIKSVVVHTDKEYQLRHVSSADAPLACAVAEIWSSVFRHLEPTRVVVAAPPTTLAGLLDTQVISADIWAFDMKMHYIELVQPEPLRLEYMESDVRFDSPALILKRPWSHLGYNEGSSIPAYSTYEYHLKQSPKMLYLVLKRLVEEVEACCNITSFSFTGVFPFATNISTITRALLEISTLKQTTFQFAPGLENNSLDDPQRMGRAQRSDFWLEWNESYKVLAVYLGVPTDDGTEFRSKDCENEQLAQDVAGCIELLYERGICWRKSDAERGVWTRDHALDRDMEDDSITYTGIV